MSDAAIGPEAYGPLFLERRRAGIVLHPTSLPSGPGNGDLGSDAFRFVDFLAESGFSVWQMLPIGPTHDSRSPYQALSVHAGNPLLINLDRLAERGWLETLAAPDADPVPPPVKSAVSRNPVDDPQAGADFRQARLQAAWRGFQKRASDAERITFSRFLETQGYWLEDYALYRALKGECKHAPWWEWSASLRDRHPSALKRARKRLATALEQQRFEQFLFFQQWQDLKHYANERGILLYGDMPIFVAEDSADAWAQREYFALDETGRPEVIAGVPPDYFSETGQRWGNPHYHWELMEKDGFTWWIERLRTQLQLCDLVRIDHFRGFEAYWEVPAEAETAIHGRWVKVPGDALFRRLQQEFDPLPVIAEDLGVITPEVEALRRRYRLPGMKILQFAFGSGPENPYLPHNHTPDYVVYTGTHDNDTTLGWFQSLQPELQREVREYLGNRDEAMPWPLIRAAMASPAVLAMAPMQDVLALDSGHRMNRPGTTANNWRWRFTWDQLALGLEERLRRLVHLYGRQPA